MRAFISSILIGALPTAHSEPIQPPITNTSVIPINFGLVIFPGFQALDVFGPLDVLNMLSDLYKTNMHLDIISKTLDPASTKLNATGNAFGEHLVVTTTFNDVLSTQQSFDVLLIPGGVGTRASVDEEIAFTKKMYPKVRLLYTF
ncbi:hypothetical protein N0V90_005445 [Kalmusia sp. IMI 367209]|nr:hypothetical protein N0V90_005445 [Kalmusia sp. IMI 367209]